jgi:hypothetical protein
MTMAVLTMAAMTAHPVRAQDKMSGDKMAGAKMSDGKMADGKKGSGKMATDKMTTKATTGLTPQEKKYATMKMEKMSGSERMAMEKKLGGLTAAQRRDAISKMMKSDKMAGDKMPVAGKMGGKM